MNKLLVAPSTDPAITLEGLMTYIKKITPYADLLHCDIMSENFVLKNTFTYKTIEEIKTITMLPLDVHLMINEPNKLLKNYIFAGANILTLHFEAYKNKKKLIKDLKMIRSNGVLSGLAIKPKTTILEIQDYLSYCDLILIMSVEPGKSGQKFIENSYEKVSTLQKIKNDYNLKLKIEVDGGINVEVSQKLKSCGADIVVSGSYVFNSDNYQDAIDKLR